MPEISISVKDTESKQNAFIQTQLLSRLNSLEKAILESNSSSRTVPVLPPKLIVNVNQDKSQVRLLEGISRKVNNPVQTRTIVKSNNFQTSLLKPFITKLDSLIKKRNRSQVRLVSLEDKLDTISSALQQQNNMKRRDLRISPS